jgi:hypothetical protein
MKLVKTIALVGSLGFSILGTPALAQSTNTTTPPVIVEPNRVPIPDDIQDLVKKFEKERKVYIDEQKILLAKLKNATTEEQREIIRAQLQKDRTDFLADIQQFREDLKAEIQELKNKLTNQELLRLIEEVKHEVEDHNHHGK